MLEWKESLLYVYKYYVCSSAILRVISFLPILHAVVSAPNSALLLLFCFQESINISRYILNKKGNMRIVVSYKNSCKLSNFTAISLHTICRIVRIRLLLFLLR